jgi:hypothetical protein
MSQRQLDIANMQCWIFHMAQSKWKLTPKECAELFKKYDIWGFISECYELLHVSSYACALDDVEDILRANGEHVSTLYLISSRHSSPIYLTDKFFYKFVYFIQLVSVGIMASILYPLKG